MSKENIILTADRLTAYVIERQNGPERYQPRDTPPWREQRQFWTDSILQGMSRLEGLEPDPKLMEQFDHQLNTAQGCLAAEPLSPKEQKALIRDLSKYISALEAAGNDRRRQIAVVKDLLDDIYTHFSWGFRENGLYRAREQAESTLLHMTARMPIRFTRILLGGDIGPCESDFVSGAVTSADAVRNTELYDRLSRQYPEVAEWPAICTVCVGRGLDSAYGTTDASDFDLDIIREAGDSFMKQPDIQPLASVRLRITACVELNEGQAGMTMAGW